VIGKDQATGGRMAFHATADAHSFQNPAAGLLRPPRALFQGERPAQPQHPKAENAKSKKRGQHHSAPDRAQAHGSGKAGLLFRTGRQRSFRWSGGRSLTAPESQSHAGSIRCASPPQQGRKPARGSSACAYVPATGL